MSPLTQYWIADTFVLVFLAAVWTYFTVREIAPGMARKKIFVILKVLAVVIVSLGGEYCFKRFFHWDERIQRMVTDWAQGHQTGGERIGILILTVMIGVVAFAWKEISQKTYGAAEFIFGGFYAIYSIRNTSPSKADYQNVFLMSGLLAAFIIARGMSNMNEGAGKEVNKEFIQKLISPLRHTLNLNQKS